jgi:DNA polymerase III subunit epsilon
MTRQVVLDTETTGLNAKLGDRIIEIGCVEVLSRRLSEREFHTYLNPERDVDLGATRVHGLTLEDLRAKPKFADVAREFLDFVAGAELIIHNAEFDVEFLDLELRRAGLGRLLDHAAKVTDTLAFAREIHPGRKNTLDALCERYFVNNANRTVHGALLDARLLAECYLAMTRGQESLVMELETPAAAAAAAALMQGDIANLIVLPALPEEIALHERYLDNLEKQRKAPSLWRQVFSSVPTT